MPAPVPALLLAAIVGAMTAACTDDDPPEPAPSASPDADRAVLAAAVERERTLLATYDAVAPVSAPARDLWLLARRHHRLHLRALESLGDVAGEPSASIAASLVTPSSGPTGAPTPSASPTGDDAATARRLLAVERSSSDAGIAAVHEAQDRELARTLAQIAASEAQHASALFIALREGLVRRGAAPAGTS